jgi:glycosyltransferase involved in cell wall biosynthesis
MTVHVILIGGEDHHLRLPFIRALRERGYRITIAASGDPDPFTREGFDFRRFQFNRFWDVRSDFRALRAIANLLREVDADVAHSFDTKLSLLVPLASRASPRTAIIRTINGRGWTFSSRSPAALALRIAYRPLQRIASMTTDATVFEHRGDQAFFDRNRLIGRSRSVLIAGAGIDIDGFERARQTGPSQQALRCEFGLEGAEIVTTVARVTKQKGIPALLQAADIVNRVRPSVRFLVVGPRESEGSFAVSDGEFERRSSYVLATGSRADVPSILGMTDVFAFPSEYAEGVPRAIMEAALCALPIVATNLPGCREVITDGWNGFLVPLHNPRSMADRILELLRDREAASVYAARGPDVVRNKFSLDTVVAGHAELYDQCFQDRQSGRAGGTDRSSHVASKAIADSAKSSSHFNSARKQS